MKEPNKRKPTEVEKPSGQTKPTKLIRLDDLVSKQDVRGGKKNFFGGK